MCYLYCSTNDYMNNIIARDEPCNILNPEHYSTSPTRRAGGGISDVVRPSYHKVMLTRRIRPLEVSAWECPWRRRY